MNTFIKDGFICGDNPNYHQQIRKSGWKSSDKADNVLVFLGIAGGRGVASWANKILDSKAFKKILGGIVNFFTGLVGLGFLSTEINNFLSKNLQSELDKWLKEAKNRLGKIEYLKQAVFTIYLDANLREQLESKFKSEISNPDHFHASILYKRLIERLWDRYGDLLELNFAANDETKKTFLAMIALHVLFTKQGFPSRNSELMNSPYGREHFVVEGFSHFANSISKYSSYNNTPGALEKWESIGNILSVFEFSEDENEVLNRYENQEIPTGYNTNPHAKSSDLTKLLPLGLGYLITKRGV